MGTEQGYFVISLDVPLTNTYTLFIRMSMLSGKVLRQVLEKMLKSPAAQEARVQVVLPDGKYYDITGVQLMENKLLGVRETHRIALTIKPETWNMGKVIKKL
tara:strand:- start:666 stop:971 length:306 start_codon:yes stop_codon:yes gene_type:complete